MPFHTPRQQGKTISSLHYLHQKYLSTQIPSKHCDVLPKTRPRKKKKKASIFYRDFGNTKKDDRRLFTLLPYLSNIPSRIHKSLKVLIADLITIHVETVNMDFSNRPFSILLYCRLISAHCEHSSWNNNHLQGKKTTQNIMKIKDWKVFYWPYSSSTSSLEVLFLWAAFHWQKQHNKTAMVASWSSPAWKN